ncbi:YhgE/Pip domain-containing protein [Rhodococcus sp. NPDC058521]|uniref:YhgE/Pip domain-containing protein n=1 Tax=Rhodococcus sp. NPDC058521 TaxID=3346536 RepID=UPI00366422DC
MADETNSRRYSLRSPFFWAAPIVAVGFIMSLLAGLYLGGMLDPVNNLNKFPIALINQDEGDTLPNSDPPEHQNFGDEIEAGLLDGLDPEQFDIRQIGIAEARSELSKGNLYGTIVIPSDFTKRTMILAQGGVIPGDIEQPIITVQTNPRAGTVAANIVDQVGERALGQVNTTMGEKLTKMVTDELAATAPDLELSGATSILFENPIEVRTVQYDPLPDGTGFGLSAFYYALLIILAGFTGATIINVLVDGMLGFLPTEVGPLYIHRERADYTRFQTLLIKWAIITVMALIVSALYLWIGTALGMPVSNPLALWEFGALAITAVGVTSISVMAVFGNLGLLINLLVFIVLGLPSSGGTIPIEASPPLFGFLAEFEPMHQVYIGARAILFFGAQGDAGLIHAVWVTLLGLLVGLLVGGITTMVYDRRGLHRRILTKESADA